MSYNTHTTMSRWQVIGLDVLQGCKGKLDLFFDAAVGTEIIPF